MQTIDTIELELQGLRKHLRRMSDSKLLRFGQAAKHACHRSAGAKGTDRVVLVMQLQAARQEWNRRKPDLPLRGSF
jgi:hypothetical protein